MPSRTVRTKWRKWTYDVGGSPQEGYQVNDRYDDGEIAIRLAVTTHNVGMPFEFTGAYPTARQLRRVFGVDCPIEVDGDDVRITVTRERDGYPIGELECTSHTSLEKV